MKFIKNINDGKKIIKSIGNSESSPLGISPKIHFVLSRIPFTDLPEDKSKEQLLLQPHQLVRIMLFLTFQKSRFSSRLVKNQD